MNSRSNEVPVLLIGYNRPEKLASLIDSLRSTAPARIVVSVDGPKPNDDHDLEKVRRTRDQVSRIDWPSQVTTRFRETNIGLRRAVEDAVTWVTSEYGSAIIIEDDTVAGPHLVDYLDAMLDLYAEREDIMHVSGYNVVPGSILRTESGSRFSRYPESFAWATWERAWKHYDSDLTWATSVSINELSRMLGSTTAALRWKINFRDAATGRIGSWAYRWIGSIWQRNGLTIAPNQNLAHYAGFDGGTHTLRRPRWTDLPMGGQLDDLTGSVHTDPSADLWTGRTVFNETPFGLLDGVASSLALASRKRYRSVKSNLTQARANSSANRPG